MTTVYKIVEKVVGFLFSKTKRHLPVASIIVLCLVAVALVASHNLYEAFVLALGGILCILLIWSNASFIRLFPLVVLIYISASFPYIASPDFPLHDSRAFHFAAFEHIAGAISTGVGFPDWFATAGGVRIGFSQLNLGFELPHRLIGYFLYSTVSMPMLTAYKLAFVLGMALVGLGWGIFLERAIHSAAGACIGVLAILLGGTGAAYHQEQVLFTITFLPWLLLALHELKDDKRWLLVILALFGLLAVTHYPQIHLIGFVLLLITVAIIDPRLIRERLHFPGWKLLVAATLLFAAAAAPLGYIYVHLDGLDSLQRPLLDVRSYQDYLRMNSPEGFSSAPNWYFSQYLHGAANNQNINNLDNTGMYVGIIGLWPVAIALLFHFRQAVIVLALTVIFALLTMGLRSPVDLVTPLYFIASPVIKYFRQWYHFFPLFNLCLAFLIALGFGSLMIWVRKNRNGWRQWLALLFAITLIIYVHDLSKYTIAYGKQYISTSAPLPAASSFLSTRDHEPSVVIYKSRMALAQCCPESISRTPYLTNEITPSLDNAEDQIQKLKAGHLTVSNASSYQSPIALPHRSRVSGSIKRIFFSYDGVGIEVETARPELLVTPVNYDLGISASVNGAPTQVWRVNGALAGIELPTPGYHRVNLKVKPDGYIPLLYAHTAVIIFIMLFIPFLLTQGWRIRQADLREPIKGGMR